MNRELQENIKTTLMDAYHHPDGKRCFYTANLDKTGVAELDAMAAWDWHPEPSREVKGNNTCIFPLGLGCQKIYTSQGVEWAQSMFAEEELEFDLQLPDVWQYKTGEILREIKYMAENLPAGEKIREPDIQSPLGVAEVVCGQGLYMALMVNPDAVHRLLDRITTFIILFIKEMRSVAGERLNGACFPCVWNNHEGTLCSDDAMTLVSPDMHREFSIPYINRIAEACGPLFYHSCSWREPYFENIKRVKNVRAYNWQSANSDDAARVIGEFSGRAVLAPHIGPGMHETEDTKKWGNFRDEIEFVRYMLEHMQDNTTFYFWLTGFDDPGMYLKFYRLFREYGFTPRQFFDS